MKPNILAVSASLRNARWGRGAEDLLDSIRAIKDEAELFNFVRSEAQIHFQHFLEAGRAEGLSFDKLYKNLRKIAGSKGLCNSEVGMVVALWAAHQAGCEIDYIPLANYFGTHSIPEEIDNKLREKILAADGLLLCTPVYFGDRSSLASDFIGALSRDKELLTSLVGKPVAGVAVGAKRNGGQETTLIYQLSEMMAFGMMGLGNDAETTSQYGGTIMAGDVGTAAEDEYGLNTALGTGRRVGRVARELSNNWKMQLKGKIRVSFWILQDANGYALGKVKKMVEAADDRIDAQILNMVDRKVGRCNACDICPTSIGPDREYRCIVRRKDDPFPEIHEGFLDQDLIVPVTLSLHDSSVISTVYQRFIERTRYLRRGDYIFTDVAILPMVFEEVGASQSMATRMLTSLVRHHTVVLKPVIGYLHDDRLLNEEEMKKTWDLCLGQVEKLAVGRLSAAAAHVVTYNPVGYVLSAAAAQELSVTERRRILHEDRGQRRIQDAENRLRQIPRGNSGED